MWVFIATSSIRALRQPVESALAGDELWAVMALLIDQAHRLNNLELGMHG